MTPTFLVKRTVEKALERAPDTEIVCREPENDVRYTYEEFYDRLSKVANVLDELGVGRGDVVSTYAPNSSGHLEVNFAVPMVGAALETVSLGFPPENISSLHRRVPKSVIFTETDQLAVLERIQDETGVETYVCFDVDDEADLPETNLPEVYSYGALIDDATSEYDFPDLDEDQTALVSHSSGTTGEPKIFRFSHKALVTYGLDFTAPDSFDVGPDDTMLLHAPLWYHNAWAYHYGTVLVGAKLVVPRSDTDEMAGPEQVGDLIEQEGVTTTYSTSSFVPMCVEAWRDNDWARDVSSLDVVVLVGVSLTQTPESVLEEFVEHTGARLTPSSGFAESLAEYAMGPPPKSADWQDQREFIYTGGTVNSLVDVKLVDPDTREEVPRDGETIGDIGLRGPYVTEGYADPEITAAKTDDEGFLYPGDIGVIDRNGAVTPRERIEDLIDGENGSISPYELSAIARGLPWVTEVATVGIPIEDDAYEIPLVCLVLAGEYETEVTADQIKEEYVGEVPDWQVPAVEVIDEFPTGNRGKRAIRPLKERFEAKYN